MKRAIVVGGEIIGHSMLDFGLGPATGKLVAELAGKAPTRIDLTPFLPNRFHTSF